MRLTAGPGEHPPGQSQGAPPTSRHVGCVDPTTHTSLQTRQEPADPMPYQTRPPPLRQPALANATLGLWLTAHENTHKTIRRPTKPPIYPRQPPSTQDKPPTPTELAHENTPTDGIRRRGPSTRTQRHLENRQEIQHPPCSQVRTPRLPTNQPKRQRKRRHLCDEATTASHPLNHGCLDHMLTPRCAQTRLSMVKILGRYIPGSRRDAVMLLPLIEFMYN